MVIWACAALLALPASAHGGGPEAPAEPEPAWEALSHVQWVESVRPGMDSEYDPPELSLVYGAPAKALEGRTIALRGFMVPLTPDPTTRRFLLVRPPDGQVHKRVAAEGKVEVLTDVAVAITNEPVVVKGTLVLLGGESENGWYYRLTGASIAAE